MVSSRSAVIEPPCSSTIWRTPRQAKSRSRGAPGHVGASVEPVEDARRLLECPGPRRGRLQYLPLTTVSGCWRSCETRRGIRPREPGKAACSRATICARSFSCSRRGHGTGGGVDQRLRCGHRGPGWPAVCAIPTVEATLEPVRRLPMSKLLELGDRRFPIVGADVRGRKVLDKAGDDIGRGRFAR
jgi:hypothetical protein